MAFNISLIQSSISNDVTVNRKLLTERILACKQADIIVLSELHDSLYFCQNKDDTNFKFAETIPGGTTNYYASLSKKLNNILVISIFEKTSEDKYYNTAVVIEKGEIKGTYRKHNIPSCNEYNESYYFESSDVPITPIQTSIGSLGVLICYDQWFPEAARAHAENGADILIIPTAIGYTPSDNEFEKHRQLDAWITIQRSHAIANGIPITVCNRVGFEKHPKKESGIDFWGHSFIAGPFGEILQSAENEDTIINATISLSENSKVRETWPFLKEKKAQY